MRFYVDFKNVPCHQGGKLVTGKYPPTPGLVLLDTYHRDTYLDIYIYIYRWSFILWVYTHTYTYIGV